jgi:hypothetical protein
MFIAVQKQNEMQAVGKRSCMFGNSRWDSVLKKKSTVEGN